MLCFYDPRLVKSYLNHGVLGVLKTETIAKIPLISNLLDLKKDEFFLDVGSGFGVFPFEMAKRSARVVAIDLSKFKIQRTKKAADAMGFSSIDCIVCDAQKLPLKDKCFDKALCSEVIEHIANDDLVISEMVRVVKKTCVITTPYREFPEELEREAINFDRHVRSGYNVQRLSKLLTTNGFCVQKIFHYYGVILEIYSIIELMINKFLLLISQRHTENSDTEKDRFFTIRVSEHIPKHLFPLLALKPIAIYWLIKIDEKICRRHKQIAVKCSPKLPKDKTPRVKQ